MEEHPPPPPIAPPRVLLSAHPPFPPLFAPGSRVFFFEQGVFPFAGIAPPLSSPFRNCCCIVSPGFCHLLRFFPVAFPGIPHSPPRMGAHLFPFRRDRFFLSSCSFPPALSFLHSSTKPFPCTEEGFFSPRPLDRVILPFFFPTPLSSFPPP